MAKILAERRHAAELVSSSEDSEAEDVTDGSDKSQVTQLSRLTPERLV